MRGTDPPALLGVVTNISANCAGGIQLVVFAREEWSTHHDALVLFLVTITHYSFFSNILNNQD
jgi:hypothetical protein